MATTVAGICAHGQLPGPVADALRAILLSARVPRHAPLSCDFDLPHDIGEIELSECVRGVGASRLRPLSDWRQRISRSFWAQFSSDRRYTRNAASSFPLLLSLGEASRSGSELVQCPVKERSWATRTYCQPSVYTKV